MNTTALVCLPLAQPPLIHYFRYGHVAQPEVRTYHLPRVWCLHVYRYEAVVVVDGAEIAVAPGCATLIPPGSHMEYRWHRPDNLHVYAHFAFPSGASSATARLPIRLELGAAFERLWQAMVAGITVFSSHPAQARSRLWSVLWELAEQGTPTHADLEHDPLVQATCERIAMAIGDPPRVLDLARAAGVSQDTLDRRFQMVHRVTVKGYVQAMRRERIRYLLGQGLLPAAVARELGITDLQAFNKLVRRLHGTSPRALAGL